MAWFHHLLCLLIGAFAFTSLETKAFQSVVPIYTPSSRTSHTPLAQAADAWSGGNSGASGASSGGSGGFGAMEQIEFKIYPDGRVEETVRGVKGNNCHKVTESINEELGEVVATRPTEEMFEQEVKVTQTLYQSDGSGDWNGGSTW